MSQRKQAAEKSSAEHYADRDSHLAAMTAADQEHARLKRDDADAKRGGVTAWHQHRLETEAALERRDVAAQAAQDAGRLGDQALERERDAKRIAAYQANLSNGEAWRSELSAYLEHCRWIQAFLARGKQIQAQRDAINRDLPAGVDPLLHIEAQDRWLPATPDREVEVEVERRVFREGVLNVSLVGQPCPTEKVIEKRIVPGSRVVVPKPLWEIFEAADLKANEPYFKVY